MIKKYSFNKQRGQLTCYFNYSHITELDLRWANKLRKQVLYKLFSQSESQGNPDFLV